MRIDKPVRFLLLENHLYSQLRLSIEKFRNSIVAVLWCVHLLLCNSHEDVNLLQSMEQIHIFQIQIQNQMQDLLQFQLSQKMNYHLNRYSLMFQYECLHKPNVYLHDTKELQSI